MFHWSMMDVWHEQDIKIAFNFWNYKNQLLGEACVMHSVPAINMMHSRGNLECQLMCWVNLNIPIAILLTSVFPLISGNNKNWKNAYCYSLYVEICMSQELLGQIHISHTYRALFVNILLRFGQLHPLKKL